MELAQGGVEAGDEVLVVYALDAGALVLGDGDFLAGDDEVLGDAGDGVAFYLEEGFVIDVGFRGDGAVVFDGDGAALGAVDFLNFAAVEFDAPAARGGDGEAAAVGLANPAGVASPSFGVGGAQEVVVPAVGHDDLHRVLVDGFDVGFEQRHHPTFAEGGGTAFAMGIEVDGDGDDETVAEVGLGDFLPIADVTLLVDAIEVVRGEGPVEAAAKGRGTGPEAGEKSICQGPHQ